MEKYEKLSADMDATILESNYESADVYHILPDINGGYALMHSWYSYGNMEYEYVDTFGTIEELLKYPNLPTWWVEVKLKDSLHWRLI